MFRIAVGSEKRKVPHSNKWGRKVSPSVQVKTECPTLSEQYLDLSLCLQLRWGELFLCALRLLWCPCLSVFVFLTVMDAWGQRIPPVTPKLPGYECTCSNLSVLIKLVIFRRSELLWDELAQRVREYAMLTA